MENARLKELENFMIETENLMIEAIKKNQPTFAPRQGRDLFWFRLQDIPLTWVYMLNQKEPLASIWWNENIWFYSVPKLGLTGTEEYQTDAWAAVEEILAEAEDNDNR